MILESLRLDKYYNSYIFSSIEGKLRYQTEIGYVAGRKKFWMRSTYGSGVSNGLNRFSG